MKTSGFRIIPLPTEFADAARREVNMGAADHALITVDTRQSSPSGHPYSETGPIFVHANECPRYSATNEYPADFREGRVFRAYDSKYNIIQAQVMNGSEP